MRRQNVPSAWVRTVALAVCALALAAAGAHAGTVSRGSAGQVSLTKSDLQPLRQRIEKRYQVIRLRESIVLVPRHESSSVKNIEISNGLILLDGTPVTGRELKSRLGDDAEAIAQLSYLPDQLRLELFAPPQPPAPEIAPPAPQSEPAPGAREVPPEESTRPDREAERRETRAPGGARVRVGGDVTVRENETVGDDVVVVLGSARVDGRVNGDVIAVGGNIHLGSKSHIGGGATSVGGRIEREDGSRVLGEINEVRVTLPRMGPLVGGSPFRSDSWLWWPLSAGDRLVATLLRVGLLGLLAAIVVLVAPAPTRRVSERVTREPLKAGAVGLVAQLLLLPLFVLTILVLVVSIIGIPLLVLIPVGIVVLLVAFLFGFAAAGHALGEAIGRRFGSSRGGMLGAMIVGLAAVWGLTVVARFAGMAGSPVRTLFSLVLLAGFLVEYAAWTVGFGGVLLSRFGRRGMTAPPVESAPIQAP